MNPWENFLQLMDATPESRRRLISHMAWVAKYAPDGKPCGCAFGTFDPTIDRETSVQRDYSRNPAPPLVGEWLASLNFTPRDCIELQSANDRGLLGEVDPERLWHFVYAYVTRRAQGYTDSEAFAYAKTR